MEVGPSAVKPSDETTDLDSGLERDYEIEDPFKAIPYPQKTYNDECILP